MKHSSNSMVEFHYPLLRPLAQATKGQSHLLRLSQQHDFIPPCTYTPAYTKADQTL
jgi:hypothetical protein